MGRVAELARWTCDACGVEGDGVGDTLPERWGGLSHEDGTGMLAFCPKCGAVLASMIVERYKMYEKIFAAADGLMVRMGLRSEDKLMGLLCGGRRPPPVVRYGILRGIGVN